MEDQGSPCLEMQPQTHQPRISERERAKVTPVSHQLVLVAAVRGAGTPWERTPGLGEGTRGAAGLCEERTHTPPASKLCTPTTPTAAPRGLFPR